MLPDLATPAELAVWLGRPATDPKLLAALSAASRRFRGAVRHPVTLVSGDVLTLDGNGRESLLLPAVPVVAVSEVLLDGAALVGGTDFSWSADGYLRRLGGLCWPDRLRCVQVTWDHGYAEIPEDVNEVIIDQARTLFRIQPGVQTIQAGGESVTYGAQSAVGVSAQWTSVVEKYQLNRGDRA